MSRREPRLLLLRIFYPTSAAYYMLRRRLGEINERKSIFWKRKIIEYQLRFIELSSVPRSRNYFIRNIYVLELFSIVSYRMQITLMKEMIHFPVFRVVNWLQVYSVIINKDATVVVSEISTVWFLHLSSIVVGITCHAGSQIVYVCRRALYETFTLNVFIRGRKKENMRLYYDKRMLWFPVHFAWRENNHQKSKIIDDDMTKKFINEIV